MPQLAPEIVSRLESVSTALADAVERCPPPGLDDGPVDAEVCEALAKLEPAALTPLEMSALYLVAGDLERSHTISQSLPSAEGSFLHGIMHRREGDYSNAKYWMRKFRGHESLEKIADEIEDYGSPESFVDRVADADRNLDATLRGIAWAELEWVLRHVVMMASDETRNGSD